MSIFTEISPMTRISHDLSMSFAKNQDAIIIGVLNEIEGERVVAIEARRLRIVQHGMIQTLTLDGKPILEFHEIEFETVETEFGWKMIATQRYRRL